MIENDYCKNLNVDPLESIVGDAVSGTVVHEIADTGVNGLGVDGVYPVCAVLGHAALARPV